MKMGETMKTAYVIMDESSIGTILERLYGHDPDGWMIVNQNSIVEEDVRYSKVQTSHKDKAKITWFRYTKPSSH